MRKAVKQIGACAFLLLLFCVVFRFTLAPQAEIYVPLHGELVERYRARELRLEAETDAVKLGEERLWGNYLRVPVEPLREGLTDIHLRDAQGKPLTVHPVWVSRFHTVVDLATGGFTGDQAVLIAVTLFWLAVSAIMVWHFRQARGPAFYAYSTIYYAGFALFALVTGLTMLTVTIRHLADPAAYNMMSAYSAINSASIQFMELTTPLILLFALAMAVSNVALLRHNRPRLQNLLGILIAVALVAGLALGWAMFTRDFTGSELEGRIQNTLQNTYATVFAYFECMLAGSVICGILAARHQPARDKDFIVILGCWFRPDGTLPPLLRGRVDRAIAFWRQQREETGREACFIPSGGRGMDEPIPEAEAMRRYLLEQGIPEEKILPEPKAVNTYENMAYALEIIRERNPQGRTAFATTNYHVFRSGVWASMADLPAEGMGSGTKWWFWPNAFMRETVGLLLKRWWQELLFLGLLILFFGLLSMIL